MTEPCGTPNKIITSSERQPLRRTCCELPVMNDLSQSRTLPARPKLDCSLCNNMSWSTQSNAALTSNKASRVTFWLSAARKNIWQHLQHGCFCGVVLSICWLAVAGGCSASTCKRTTSLHPEEKALHSILPKTFILSSKSRRNSTFDCSKNLSHHPIYVRTLPGKIKTYILPRFMKCSSVHLSATLSNLNRFQ